MKAVKVVIATYDDWEGLYVDGTLITEGHRIKRDEFVYLIDTYKSFTSIEVVEISDDCLGEYGNCPMLLEDVY